MTPLARLLRALLERLLGTWDEGPEPPGRLREAVLLFAEANPRASRRQWLEFAAGHAAEAYRTGYVRGYECSARDEREQPWRRHPPEEAPGLDPDWDLRAVGR